MDFNKRTFYLSDSFRNTLLLMAEGYSAYEVSKKLKISSRTVEARLSQLKKEFGCKNTVSLIAFCLRTKIIS